MPVICPGQDTRYWRPEDIFDIPCGVCGKDVEFFKDDVTRRCRSCGTLIRNPKISLGCAQWCEHAKECLGYDPKEMADEVADQGSLLDQLIAALKVELGSDQERISRALAVTEEAEELVRQAEVERRTVLASALLHDFGQNNGSDTSVARKVMEKAGLEGSAIQDVVNLIVELGSDDASSPEARLLRRALNKADSREKERVQ